ncbi:MAG: hypothetical protein QNJ98_01940 [Planctomycetota bacterium]|nr:hypothetical protein [Planctomycetota bacterium]
MKRTPSLLPLLVCLLLPFGLGACGGGGGAEPFVATPPAPSPGGGGGVTPAPLPGPTVTWNADAVSYGRTAQFGSFPSSLVAHGDTLFATDADQIEAAGARILATELTSAGPVSSTRFQNVTIQAGALVDSRGAAPGLTPPIGFGYFLGEIHIVSDTLGFVLVNAGGSDSDPSLSNLVAFDPTTGTLTQVLNLANVFTAGFPLFDSTGAAVPDNAFVQSQAEGVTFVPTTPSRGLLYVCMANIVVGAPSFGAVKYPGTVQVFEVDLTQAQPVAATPTKTLRTQAYNPVAVQSIVTDLGGRRILVTCAGTTAFDANFDLVPVTNAAVEAYEAVTQDYLGTFVLGLAGLSGIPPALGADASGQRVGFFPSSTTGEVYLVLLEGLFSPVVDTTQLAVLRGPDNGIPITAAAAGGPGGNVTGVALSPDGRTLVVSGFGDLFAFPAPLPGRLFLLSLPSDLVTGSGFGAAFVPGSTEFATTPGRTLGEVVVRPSGGTGPDVFVNVGGTLNAAFVGSGPASLGALDTAGLIR